MTAVLYIIIYIYAEKILGFPVIQVFSDFEFIISAFILSQTCSFLYVMIGKDHNAEKLHETLSQLSDLHILNYFILKFMLFIHKSSIIAYTWYETYLMQICLPLNSDTHT